VLESLLADSMNPATLRSLASSALDFPLPLVPLSHDLFILELFRGPTLAFKDVGARFLARLLGHFLRETEPLTTVLTATSGDTGGAVAHAFHAMPGIRVVVLYPEGKVSARQERQFSTLGGNVQAVSVQGDFDDCQRLAKEAFRREKVHGTQRSGERHRLTSANSINVGRFLPQITYYFHLWAELRERLSNKTKILISIPSGNFGNLAAGLMALSMGIPDLSFLAATNENDVVPEYLRQGKFQPRASVPTLSTAMDVGNPSNLDRILHLYGGKLEGLRRDLTGRKVTDRETRGCIQRTYEENGYILDPHGAVGLAALQKEMQSRPGFVGVVLATAHPAKFAEVVEPLLGFDIPIPPELRRCLEAERQVVSIPPRVDALTEILRPGE
jgi:threonine synthase